MKNAVDSPVHVSPDIQYVSFKVCGVSVGNNKVRLFTLSALGDLSYLVQDDQTLVF